MVKKKLVGIYATKKKAQEDAETIRRAGYKASLRKGAFGEVYVKGKRVNYKWSVYAGGFRKRPVKGGFTLKNMKITLNKKVATKRVR